jgi:hypothetical protein
VPLQLSLIRFQLACNWKGLSLTSNTALDLQDHSFVQTVEAGVSF